MNRKRIYLGLGILLISTLSINSSRKDMDGKETNLLRNIDRTIIAMEQDEDIIVMDDRIFIRNQNEILLKEAEIEETLEEEQIAGVLEEVKPDEILEEGQIEEEIIKKDIVVAKIIEKEDRDQPSPNRGVATLDNRNNKIDLSNHLNNYVLDVIKTYSTGDGNHPYLLNNDFQNYNGVTEDLYYQGELILKANPNGDKSSHCTGITFEVFFKAMQNRNKALGVDINNFNGMGKAELRDFILTWYVALGSKDESNLAVAIEKYGLGNRISDMEALRPGDFIDLSRENNSGHAVIFINWIREGNKIIGLKYWSSQGSTNGISYKEEYFNIRGSNGEKYGNVRMDNLHMVRVNPIKEYKKY